MVTMYEKGRSVKVTRERKGQTGSAATKPIPSPTRRRGPSAADLAWAAENLNQGATDSCLEAEAALIRTLDRCPLDDIADERAEEDRMASIGEAFGEWLRPTTLVGFADLP